MAEILNSTELRRELHPMAELGLEVKNTSEFVLSKLRSLGIEADHVPGTWGVLGVIRGKEPGPVVLLRADMDALPFKDEAGKTIAIHACGHDGHTSMLLEAASRLVGRVKKGTLKLLFQPAEETMQGALLMVEKGVLDDVDIAVGAHIRPIQDLKPGTMCASVLYSGFAFPIVTVHGKPAHGSRPQLGVNAIDAAAAIIGAVNAIHMTPDVHWTVKPTQIKADGAMNIIPAVCTMRFDIRAKKNDVMQELLAKFRRAVESTAQAYGASAEINMGTVGPAPDYDPEIEKELAECIEEVAPGKLAGNCGGGGEDFNFFKTERPAIRTGYFGVGVGAAPGLHNRDMHFDDTLLPMGAKVFEKFVLKHLG